MGKPSSKGKKATSVTSNDSKPSASSAEDIFYPENPASATITVSAVEVPELTGGTMRSPASRAPCGKSSF